MIIWVFVFAYYPMYGLVIAFQNYIPGHSFLSGPWIGLDNFMRFFQVPEFRDIMRNTIAISLLNIAIGFPVPIILAVLFSELRVKWFKKTVQSISYMPYFISWVVVASIATLILGSEGTLNDLLLRIGIIDQPILFLGEGKYFWSILVLANVWKDAGFNTIIYLSAIAGIDKELYEAGKVDGLGRYGLIRHITLPGITTTMVLLFILSIGNILSAGFEQQLLLGTPLTQEYYEVIDTYVYRFGVQLGNYSFGAAVGLMKALFGIVLVFAVNHIAKKKLDTSIF
ncbi:MAG: sugar ABC transporter permease [Gorillibacterium sp.]|nr:sugar ABC transporter permease [Gorillibacterium sp.]